MSSIENIEIFVKSCVILAIKSARLSLILRITSILYILMNCDEFNDIEINLENCLNEMNNYIDNIESNTINQNNENSTNQNFSKHQLYCEIQQNKEIFSYIQNNQSKGGLLLSFGKCDHGKLGHGDATVSSLIEVLSISLGFDLIRFEMIS